MNRVIFAISALVLSIGLLTHFWTVPASAENIDPLSAGSHYAYGENVGWINFKPSFGPGVNVADMAITGYAWGENVGWINLSPLKGGTKNDGIGNLSGYAWGENIGWISFSCENTATCGTVSYRVTINPETGTFSGKAWGENVGWINFDTQLQLQYMIVTSWRGQITISGRVAITIAGHADLGVTNASVSLEGTAYTTTTDSNGDFSIVGVPPGTYALVVDAPDLISVSQEIEVSQGQQLETGLPQMTVLNQVDLDKAVGQAVEDTLQYWDAKGDGKMGLEEAIRALQVVSGVRTE
jgi:hypothetical protein